MLRRRTEPGRRQPHSHFRQDRDILCVALRVLSPRLPDGNRPAVKATLRFLLIDGGR
jgi:hypothetical protein